MRSEQESTAGGRRGMAVERRRKRWSLRIVMSESLSFFVHKMRKIRNKIESFALIG